MGSFYEMGGEKKMSDKKKKENSVLNADLSPVYNSLFVCLSSTVRLEILRYLSTCPMSVTELANHMKQPKGCISRHIRVMEDCGLVHYTNEKGIHGRKKIYSRSAESVHIVLNDLGDRNAEPGELHLVIPVADYEDCMLPDGAICGLMQSGSEIYPSNTPNNFLLPAHKQADELCFDHGTLVYNMQVPLLRKSEIVLFFEAYLQPLQEGEKDEELEICLGDTRICSIPSSTDLSSYTYEFYKLPIGNITKTSGIEYQSYALRINREGSWLNGRKASGVTVQEITSSRLSLRINHAGKLLCWLRNGLHGGITISTNTTHKEGSGMHSILEFGVVPDTDKDQSTIIEKALESCDCLYFPKGVYKISRPIHLLNKKIVGEGQKSTIILMTSRDSDVAVIRAGGKSQIESISLGFDDGILTGNEREGQRVGLSVGCNKRALSWGSSVRNVRIFSCGTGIYSSDMDNSSSASVTYDTLEISNFSYRGVDFTATNRTGNVFTNIYMYSRKYAVDTLFSMDTEESEVSIHQLNVEHAHCKYGIRLRGVRAAAISSLHAENLFLDGPESAVMYLENSSVTIDAMSVYYVGLKRPYCRLFELGDTVYDLGYGWQLHHPENLGYLHIGTLHLKGINSPWMKDPSKWPARGLEALNGKDFLIFHRREDAKGEYRVEIDQYVYYTFNDDVDIYESLPSQGRIDFIKKGQLDVAGPSSRRPVNRLCPYHTTYFDTDLMKMLIWTGSSWETMQ